MKNILFTLVIFVVVMMTACERKQSTEDLIAHGSLVAIRLEKKELSAEKKKLTQQIQMLEEKINAVSGNKKLHLVTTFQAQTQKFTHYLELQGDVATRKNVIVFPEVGGILTKILVKEGQRITKGQTLATVHDGGVKHQLDQMNIQLTLSKTIFERQERLWQQKIGSEIQYLQAKSSYETQQSAVMQLKRQLDKFTIKAPFTGVIDDVFVAQGVVLNPSTQLFRVINLSEMYIKVPVPETYIAVVNKGTAVAVNFATLNTKIQSVVRQTGNFINPNNRSFIVEVSVPNKDGRIKPNMSAKVRINDYSTDQAILIPQSIISENADGQQYVFVTTNIDSDGVSIATKKIITTGKSKENVVEVLSGIKPNEHIIEEGARSVKDGQQVKILTK